MDPHIYAPGWWRSPSGLELPSTLRSSGEDLPPDLPKELRPRPAPVAVHRPVDASDQIRAYVDEATLGFEPTAEAELFEIVELLPFEWAIEMVSICAARAAGAGRSIESQMWLAREIFGGTNLPARFEEALRRNPGTQVYGEQNINALLQLLLLRAGPSAEPTEEHRHLLIHALLAVTAVTDPNEALLLEREGGAEEMLAYLIQLSQLFGRPGLLQETTRATLMLEAAAIHEAQAYHDYCPVEQWFEEDLGLTAAEQRRLMTAIAAQTDAFSGSKTKTRLAPEAVAGLLRAAGFAGREGKALGAIAATRKEFRANFAALGPPGPVQLLWESRPFKEKPFLLREDGGLILLSPRFLERWLGEGFHYRALKAAQRRGEGAKYQAFSGRTYEEHCLGLAEVAHRPDPATKVSGERPYKKGPAGKTADIVVDSVTDLVLIETTNSRFRVSTLIEGGPAASREDLDRVLVNKCRQLDGCIDRVLAGHAPFPEAPGKLKAVWPVIVSAGIPTQTPMLWDYLRLALPEAFKQPPTRPLTLLDPDEYEILCGLVEDGTTLPDILRRKTAGAYRDLDLKAWLADDPQAPKMKRPLSSLDRAFSRTTQEIAAGIRFSDEAGSGSA
jgi:hypothetical protein